MADLPDSLEKNSMSLAVAWEIIKNMRMEENETQDQFFIRKTNLLVHIHRAIFYGKLLDDQFKLIDPPTD